MRMMLILLPAALAGCGMEMPSMSSMVPNMSPGVGSGPIADPAAQVASLPRGSDALGNFAASATPGQAGTVNGEAARYTRSYNAASGRECREIALGYGGNERVAVACRRPDGTFAASRPLLRGSLR
jgi:hypothetical protein